MKIVGLTGGIGSGKTTVAKMFKELGVPVYISDVEAKKLTQTSKIIKRKLTQLLGEQTYKDGVLNKKYVANKIFNNQQLLEDTNAIIHPKVSQHFKKWIKKQKGNFCIKESAILFENGTSKNCDYTILVTSPKKVKIQRILQRDKTTLEAIEARMNNQWLDEKKEKLADFVIENIDLEITKEKVKKLYLKLSKL
ncbi:MAG: dephospho-CoA kinase [Flavobacteriales bacterium]